MSHLCGISHERSRLVDSLISRRRPGQLTRGLRLCRAKSHVWSTSSRIQEKRSKPVSRSAHTTHPSARSSRVASSGPTYCPNVLLSFARTSRHSRLSICTQRPFRELSRLRDRANDLYCGPFFLRCFHSQRDAAILKELQDGVTRLIQSFTVSSTIRLFPSSPVVMRGGSWSVKSPSRHR